MIMVNGVVQEISVDGSEPTELYIYELETTYTGPAETEWNKRINADFVPRISVEDKDEEKLYVTLLLIGNPHVLTTSDWLATCHSVHPSGSFAMNVKEPIENFTDDIGSGVHVEAELITEQVMDKFSKMRSQSNFDYSMINAFDDGMSNMIYLTEEGKVEVGFMLTTHEASVYRVFFLLNGTPTTLGDGASYIEVYAELEYAYSISPMLLPEGKLCDSIDAIAIAVCKDGSPNHGSTDCSFIDVVRPAENEEEDMKLQPWSPGYPDIG